VGRRSRWRLSTSFARSVSKLPARRGQVQIVEEWCSDHWRPDQFAWSSKPSAWVSQLFDLSAEWRDLSNKIALNGHRIGSGRGGQRKQASGFNRCVWCIAGNNGLDPANCRVHCGSLNAAASCRLSLPSMAHRNSRFTAIGLA